MYVSEKAIPFLTKVEQVSSGPISSIGPSKMSNQRKKTYSNRRYEIRTEAKNETYTQWLSEAVEKGRHKMWWRDESGYDMRLHCTHKFYFQWLKYIKTIWKISERSRKRCNLLMHFSFLAICRTLKNLLQFTFFINEHLPILNNFIFIRVFFRLPFIHAIRFLITVNGSVRSRFVFRV